MMMKKQNTMDEELELVQEMGCMNVIINKYLKSPWPDVTYEENHEVHDIKRFSEQNVMPATRRTHVCIWGIALLGSLLAIAIILSGLAVLIGYLLFHPKLPKLDVIKASLNNIYLDTTTDLYNSEMVALLSINNPNDRVDVRYEYINFKLFFRNDMVATQILEPFAQRRGNTTLLMALSMFSTDKIITPLSVQIMTAQARNNSIEYQLVGDLKTVAKLGTLARIPYWLNVNCRLHFTTPPKGVLQHRECTTTR